MSARSVLAALLVANKLAPAREVERIDKTRGALPLWAALLQAEILDDRSLFELLRKHGGAPVASLKQLANAGQTEQLRKLVSQEDAIRLGVLPLDLSADKSRLQLAMIDPTDAPALRGLAQAHGIRTAKVLLIDRVSLVAAIQRAYAVADAPSAAPPQVNVRPAGKVNQRSPVELAERSEQVLVQIALALGGALEAELVRGGSMPVHAVEAARLGREVARELGHDRRQVALAGVGALLVQLDRSRRAGAGEDDPTLYGDLGWAAGGEDGLLDVLQAFSGAAAGFPDSGNASAAQRVVQVVVDYLSLGLAGALTVAGDGLDAASDVLRTSAAGTVAVDALIRVLRREKAERGSGYVARPEGARRGSRTNSGSFPDS